MRLVDAQALKKLSRELPTESPVFADSTCTNYEIEDQLMEAELIALEVHRKLNTKGRIA